MQKTEFFLEISFRDKSTHENNSLLKEHILVELLWRDWVTCYFWNSIEKKFLTVRSLHEGAIWFSLKADLFLGFHFILGRKLYCFFFQVGQLLHWLTSTSELCSSSNAPHILGCIFRSVPVSKSSAGLNYIFQP